MSAKARTVYKIVPATENDIPAMANSAGDAFETDTHTLLQAIWKGKDFHRDGSREHLKDMLANPRVKVLVAREGVDGEGKVLGFVMWGTRGYPPKVEGQDPDAPVELTSKTTTKATMLAPAPAPVQPSDPTAPLTIKELGETTNNSMNHFMDLLMPEGTQCRFVVGLNVSPAYQGQGIGTQLLKWGTDRADQEETFCWVSSSMDGAPAYAKSGFVEVGRQEVRLDDYSQGIKRKVVNKEGIEEEQDWGIYIWKWMRRDPKSIV